MAITDKNLDFMLQNVNISLRTYISDIEAIKLSKIGNKYSIEAVINGNQIDSFYKVMTKKDVYNALKIIEIVLFRNAHTSYDLVTEKTSNTEFIKHLLQTFNEFNA